MCDYKSGLQNILHASIVLEFSYASLYYMSFKTLTPKLLLVCLMDIFYFESVFYFFDRSEYLLQVVVRILASGRNCYFFTRNCEIISRIEHLKILAIFNKGLTFRFQL